MSDPEKKKKTWRENMPWSRQSEIADEARRQEFDNNYNPDGDTIYFNIAAWIRGLKKWRKRRNSNKDTE